MEGVNFMSRASDMRGGSGPYMLSIQGSELPLSALRSIG